MQGPVKKLSDVLKVWNSRYLVLIPRNKTLVYYIKKPKTDHENSKGGYDLSDGISLRDLPKVPNGFMICVPGKNDIVLQVPSPKDKASWIKALKPFTHEALQKGGATKDPGSDEEAQDDGQYAWMWEAIVQETQPPHRTLQDRKEALDQESNRLFETEKREQAKQLPTGFFVGTIPIEKHRLTPDVNGLHEAIRSDDHDTVLNLLEDDPSLLTSRDVYMNTPLHLAAISDASKVARLLLHKGVDAKAQNKLKETAVEIAPETLALVILDRSKGEEGEGEGEGEEGEEREEENVKGAEKL